MFANPYNPAIKQIFLDILKEKYNSQESTIEKIASLANSEKEYENIGKLILSVYETAYLKAVEEHKEILKKNGISVVIASSENKNNKIFK